MPRKHKRQNSNYQTIRPSLAQPPPRNSSTILNLRLRRKIAATGLALSVILIITTVIWLADTYKGYDVRQIDAGTYQIDVVLDRATAREAIERIRGQKLSDEHPLESTEPPEYAPEYYPLRDVRLPGGILATGVVSYAQAAEFYLSGKEYTTISTIWKASEYTGAKITAEANLVTTYVKFSYREMMDYLQAAREESTSQHLLDVRVNLPNNRTGACFLTLTELESYTRRMHKVGAKQIILPFYWQLDLSQPAIYPNFFI